MSKQRLIQFVKILLALLLIGFVFTRVIHFEDTLIQADPKAVWPVSFESIQDPVVFTVDKGATPPAGLGEYLAGNRVEMPADVFHERFEESLGLTSILRFARKDLLPLICLFTLFGYSFAIVRWYFLLRALKIDVSFREVYVISWIGMFFNNILISLVGGDIIRALYIVRKTNEKTIAVTSLMIDRVLGLMGLAILALFCILPNVGDSLYLEAGVLVAVLVGGASTLGAVFFIDRVRQLVFHNRFLKPLPIYPMLQQVAKAGERFKDSKRLLIFCLFLSVCGNLCYSFVVAGFGMAVNAPGLTLAKYLVIVPICQLIASVPIAPAGWGIAEVSYAYFFKELGGIASYGAVVSFMLKVNNIIISLPGLALWAFSGKNYSTKAMQEMEAEMAQDADAPAEAAS